MDIPQGLLPIPWLMAGAMVYAALVVWAGMGIEWRRLKQQTHRQHVLLAASMAVMVLWLAGNASTSTINGHLLGMTTLTLMVGWRPAMIGSLFPVIGAAVVGVEPWATAGLAGLMLAAVPIGITHMVWRISARTLPRSLSIYLGVCVFCGSALTVVLARGAIGGLVASTGIYALGTLGREFFSMLPMALIQEVGVNLAAIAALVFLRPNWLMSLQQRRYFSR